jgi:hypothetical protein
MVQLEGLGALKNLNDLVGVESATSRPQLSTL